MPLGVIPSPFCGRGVQGKPQMLEKPGISHCRTLYPQSRKVDLAQRLDYTLPVNFKALQAARMVHPAHEMRKKVADPGLSL